MVKKNIFPYLWYFMAVSEDICGHVQLYPALKNTIVYVT